eukprot:363982-Chlamydomonas_euryale.AAC.3
MGWSSTMRVTAHLLTLKDAAARGSSGILRPLLHKHLAGELPSGVFALPAVQVRPPPLPQQP